MGVACIPVMGTAIALLVHEQLFGHLDEAATSVLAPAFCDLLAYIQCQRITKFQLWGLELRSSNQDGVTGDSTFVTSSNTDL
jgi:hypothetical protein